MFLVDDLGWTDVGIFGSDLYQTPNVDKLAVDGIKFDNAYSSCTVCSPSRASIMTGKYPAKLKLTDWIEGWNYPKAKLKIPDWTMYLDLEEVTMAEVLKNEGYRTGHFGKWHLGEEARYWPENHGFDVNKGGWAKGSPNRNEKKGSNGYFSPYGNPRLQDPSTANQEEYLTERLANEACKFIDQKNSDPFFLNFWFYNVHTPLQARQDKINKYQSLTSSTKNHQNPTYAAMVEHMDEAVGKVIDKLKASGQYDNSIIIFTSDNGGLIGRGKNMVTNNFPLRDGKGSIYEGGVRVPLIIKLPNSVHGGNTNDNVVTSIDYLPTIIDFLNIDVTKQVRNNIDGVSIVPALQNNSTKLNRESVFWHYPHYHSEGATPYSAVRKGKWKLIHVLETDSFEMYNLESDIGEKNDVANNYPAIVSELKQDLTNWKSAMDAQMPTPNSNYSPK